MASAVLEPPTVLTTREKVALDVGKVTDEDRRVAESLRRRDPESLTRMVRRLALMRNQPPYVPSY
jgi:hypothetical protein